MMNIKLYGTERCHKTQFYKDFFTKKGLDFVFLDVEQNEGHANELRALYVNRRLNFPTITINNKKLRNPSEKELIKWIEKHA